MSSTISWIMITIRTLLNSKRNNMEIKVGDKVRVREDAPRIYTQNCLNLSLHNTDFEVANIEDGCANIQNKDGILTIAYVIPTKYLTKVEDEAKESKFKVGDKVRKKKWDKDTTISYVEWHGTWQTYVYRFAEQEYGFNCHKEEDITLVSRRAKEPKFKTGDCVKISFEWNDLPIGEKLVIKRLETIDCRDAYMYSIEGYGGCVIESMLHPYTEPTTPTIKVGDVVRCKSPLRLKNSTDDDFIGTVTDAENGWFIVHMNNGAVFQTCNAVDLELVQPKEQAEEVARIRQMEAELDEFRKAELDRVSHPEKYHTYEVTVDNVAMGWQRYEADLAKEIAVKLSKPNENKPGYVADYAVSVAKAVVENLKKK